MYVKQVGVIRVHRAPALALPVFQQRVRRVLVQLVFAFPRGIARLPLDLDLDRVPVPAIINEAIERVLSILCPLVQRIAGTV